MEFRFAIMGAGKIARKFCDAVGRVEGAVVAAVASKSAERAESFATEHGIGAFYGSYEEMLRKEKPDCVYIATTPDSHYALSMLCLDYRTPVLCEKAMFMHTDEAEKVFARAKELNVFVMEALWSRFLPTMNHARQWLRDGKIGAPVYGEMSLGFIAPNDPENRYLNPKLGGGAAFDITVYCYHRLSWMLEREVERSSFEVVTGPTGVDVTELVLLRFTGNVPAVIKCSIAAASDKRLVIHGTEGRIVINGMPSATDADLIAPDGQTLEHFADTETPNGFIFEIEEAIRCVREGLFESPTVPHSATLSCTRLLDRLTH